MIYYNNVLLDICYNDLQKYNYDNWDGKPFYAFRCDCEMSELKQDDIEHFNYFINQQYDKIRGVYTFINHDIEHGWLNKNSIYWLNVYRFDENITVLKKLYIKQRLEKMKRDF